MDPRKNPFAPGAGIRPPELAGRDELVTRAEIALDRIRAGRAARSFILYGLRGVGKTVLLERIRNEAEARKIITARIEAPEKRSLPAMLVPVLRKALIELDRIEAAKDLGQRAWQALASFIKLKAKYDDIEVAIELKPEIGVADSGDLDLDLTELLVAVGKAAHSGGTALVLFIDELQYVPEDQLASLIGALHATAQAQLPVTMMAAGLPQLLAQMGRAKSYAERLFEFVPIDKLDPAAARNAVVLPIQHEGAEIVEGAVTEIIEQTHGYPYFLQEWGKHSWDIAEVSPIQKSDVIQAALTALAELDASFFRVRFDRLTPSEKRYMRALAELGPGVHRSGEVADLLGKKVRQLGPVRDSLIKKGMLYSPAHGDNAFTVPLFDEFMRRIIPDFSVVME